MIEATDPLSATDDGPFEKPPLNAVLLALRQLDTAPDRAVAATVVYGLSEPPDDDCRALEAGWRQVSPASRLRVLRALIEASEAMFEVNYREVALFSLGDADGQVRAAAIELLWTDESVETLRRLMTLAADDPEATVRAAASKELGRFILLGEYGDIPEAVANEAQRLALRLYSDRNEALEIRRRALEALGNSSHPQVEALIRAAHADGNHDLKISAIFAMGRTCNKIWREILLEELESSDNEIVFEAVTACGQIQLGDSVRRVGELTLADDREVQLAAIWALGEIGGKQAFDILTNLDEMIEDEEAAAVLEEALDTAGFNRTFAALGLDLDQD